MRLSDVPGGTTIFIDANCAIYHFTGTHPSCALLLERARRRDIHGVTSVVSLGEIHHRLMVVEMAQRLGRPVRNLPAFLNAHPELVRTLSRCERAMDVLRGCHLRVLAVTPRLFLEARRLSHELGLLTNDALIVATMRAHHLLHLASNDAAFARVPGLTVWRP